MKSMDRAAEPLDDAPKTSAPAVTGPSGTSHETTVTRWFLPSGWTASCACGWQGVEQDDIGAAQRDAYSHREFVAR